MASTSSESASKQPDLELKRAFAELQTKMVETKQKIKLSDLQIENLKRTITHSELTAAEIDSLPDETRVFESVGRMFVLSDKPGVGERLADRKSECKTRIEKLEANTTYLERSIKESENALRELIMQKKSNS